MIADCPRCAGRGWIDDAGEEGARECEACHGRGTVDTAPDDPRAVREPDSLGGRAA
jgi:DnaJ-class molecular chaperone